MIRSGGGKLTTYVDRGEPGDVFVQARLGHAAAELLAGLTVLVEFTPPVQLPRRGDLYDVKRIPKGASDGEAKERASDA